MRVGNYQLLTRLGEGGMGVVHLGRADDGRRVAVKVIRPNVVGDDESRARLAREVNSLSRVRSPRVAEVIDADPWGPVPYVATRYVPGYSLHDLVAQQGPQEPDDLLWTARCLAEALVAVHAAGVLHRDVKPSNVLMEGRSPVLIDFGLARVAEDDRLTAQGWLLGTPGYLAPEILHGEDPTPAADVHSWAATVAYAGTGRAPFGRGPSVAVMDRVRRGEHDLTGLEGDLLEVVEAALDPEPRNRPTLAAALTWLDPDDTMTTVVEHRPFPAAAADPAPFLVVPETRPVPAEAFGHDLAPYGQSPYAEPDRFASDDSATALVPSEAPNTFADPGDLQDPAGPTRWIPAAQTAVAPAGHQPGTPASPQPIGYPGVYPDGAHGFAPQSAFPWEAEPSPQEPRAGFAERARRAVVLVALVLVVACAATAAPYVTATLLTLVVWCVRAGSLTSSSVERRRARRGPRWYDRIGAVLAWPYHLVAAVPGTVALLLWAAGLATVTALVCFALATTVPTGLFAVGATAGLGLWLGPGADRLRQPVKRAVDGAAANTPGWCVAVSVLLAVAWLLGQQVMLGGGSGDPDWFPAAGMPGWWS